ncbi:MAG: [FeFe] hydrogenase H-cluster radical SAM maturase HydG, partial [Clostridiales bacterium]
HDRAMQGGIVDVGLGALFGLYDWHYDFFGLLMHAEHLEAVFGVGPHTLSMPRIRPAEGMSFEDFPYAVDDNAFRKIVAILRLAVPYTGMIISTRESESMREELLNMGISQLSAGSSTGVGGYQAIADHTEDDHVVQFEVSDHRSPIEVTKDLLKKGFIPSFCTACYREGRTGDRFMALAKTGNIGNICQPNAMLTLKEYSEDYGDAEFKALANQVIEENLQMISNPVIKEKAQGYLQRIANGERDFRF